MENLRQQRARDRLRDLGGSLTQIIEQNRGGAERYDQAGRVGRWFIRRREPEVLAQYQAVHNARAAIGASESRQEAIRSAYANEGQEVIIF